MINQESSHYDAKYFAWYKRIGEFGGQANVSKFQNHITDSDNVVDYGCGGGYILSNLRCCNKIGIEVNPTAIQEMATKGITCFTSCDYLQDEWADVIISNSVLEHTLHPLDEIKKLNMKLKSNGRMVFSVPCESPDWKFVAGDINQHLYSWSPQSLGNLFRVAGFDVVSVDAIKSMWPPFSPYLFAVLGNKGFELISTIYWFLRFGFSLVFPMKVAASLLIVAKKRIPC